MYKRQKDTSKMVSFQLEFAKTSAENKIVQGDLVYSLSLVGKYET